MLMTNVSNVNIVRDGRPFELTAAETAFDEALESILLGSLVWLGYQSRDAVVQPIRHTLDAFVDAAGERIDLAAFPHLRAQHARYILETLLQRRDNVERGWCEHVHNSGSGRLKTALCSEIVWTHPSAHPIQVHPTRAPAVSILFKGRQAESLPERRTTLPC